MSYFLPTHSVAMTGEIVKPHVLLKREMKRLGWGPVAFAEKIGVEYQTLARWRRGMFFNEENQETCAIGLGLPPDHFKQPDIAEILRRKRAEVFKLWVDHFRARKDVQPLSPAEQEVLQRMAEADPTRVPLPEWFTVQISLHRGNLSRDEAASIIETTRKLDEEIFQEERESRAKPLSKKAAKKADAGKKAAKSPAKQNKKTPAP